MYLFLFYKFAYYSV